MYTKKRIIIGIVAIIAMCGISTGTHAAGMKVGATAWYSWWDSTFIKKTISGRVNPFTVKTKYDMNSAPLYGPILAFDFAGKWSVNIVFACGSHFNPEGRHYAFDGDVGIGKTRASIYKYDLDPTLTFSVNKYLKVFAGMKLQGYVYDATQLFININTREKTLKNDLGFTNYGPGLGISITVPLTHGFYLLTNASGLYLRSAFYYNENRIVLLNSSTPFYYSRRINNDLNIFGFNTGLSVAYIIPAASVTLSIGGRYQFMKYRSGKLTNMERDYLDSNPIQNLFMNMVWDAAYQSIMKRALNNSKEHFYGLTFSVIYSIDFSDIGKKSEG